MKAMAERAAFEKWAWSNYLSISRRADNPDMYLCEAVQFSWVAWNARASIATVVGHTKGEWTVFDNRVADGFEDGSARIGVSAKSGDIAHCWGFYSDRSDEEVLANAYLIAAAPDMLEALKLVWDVAVADRWTKTLPESPKRIALDAVANAIVKAGGPRS